MLEQTGDDHRSDLIGEAEEPTTTSGGRQRRAWLSSEKRAMVELTMEPGASVPQVAASFGVAPASLYGWRKQVADGSLDEPAPMFAKVVVDQDAAPVFPDRSSVPGKIIIAFPSGVRMRIEGSVDGETLALALAELGR